MTFLALGVRQMAETWRFKLGMGMVPGLCSVSLFGSIMVLVPRDDLFSVSLNSVASWHRGSDWTLTLDPFLPV